MKVAVLGAGHGGQAMAADLKLAGHEVRLGAVEPHSGNLKIIEYYGGVVLQGITSSGASPGFARLDTITTDIGKAIRGARVIMIVIPAFAQETYMRALIDHLEPHQIVVFNPGKFASLVFRKMLDGAGKHDVVVGETSCLLYAAKTRGLGHVHLKAVKDLVPFAAIPSVQTGPALWVLADLFKQLSVNFNVFQTSIDDPGMVVHSISTILNVSRIELMGPYKNSHYDITPSVGRAIEAIDAERVAIAKALQLEVFSMLEIMNLMYKVNSASVYEGEYKISAHDVQMAPESLQHRYITEELPYSLVPLSGLGKALGIATPGIDSIVHLGGVCNATDYWKTGRTLEDMGIAGLDAQRMIEYVTFGTAGRKSHV